ncbi:MAG: SMC-Scp complex subunit ScpB [Candidatus Methanoperedens sp.]|jgi:segregation and condensation protein B|nr:SMC-Scp complex subunit ScpB [Candidatus Methanoperedens sp.]
MITDKGIIEAALFVSGEPLDTVQLRSLVKKKDIQDIIHGLMDEYRQRNSPLEIKEVEGRYVMQVKPEYAERVRPIAPKELRAPVLRTLSMIAYHQPIIQSELVDRRGAATYEHVRELEERGLISAKPEGRSRILQTTPQFAEYFNLNSSDPEEIKRMIISLAREQKMGLDKWLGKQGIGVTPMYESLMELCGISGYEVVNPYNADDTERERIQELGVLIISKGYEERAGGFFDGRIIEVSASTFEELTNSINILAEYGSHRKVRESIEYISGLKDEYIEKTFDITVKVSPQTEMIAHMVNELKLGISSDGVKVAPDYETSGSGELVGNADIFIPTHRNADMDAVKRVCQRYDVLIEGLKK